jgi:hypothetical protein
MHGGVAGANKKAYSNNRKKHEFFHIEVVSVKSVIRGMKLIFFPVRAGIDM